MSGTSNNAILSEEEIEAALAEIDASSGGGDDIPSLDDGTEPEPTPAPAPKPRKIDIMAGPKPQPEKKAGNVINIVGSPPKKSDSSDTSEQDETPKDDVEPEGRIQIAKEKVIWFVDSALDTMNQPFARFGETTRNWIGRMAIVTILVAIVMCIVNATFLKKKTAVDFLFEKCDEATMGSMDSPDPAAAE